MPQTTVAAYLNQTITQALEAQNLRFRQYWEPRVVEALAPLAGECRSKIGQALARQRRLPWHRRNPAALRLELGAGCAPLAAAHRRAAGEVLLAMVRQEGERATEALRLGGLLGEPPLPAWAHPDPQGQARRLAAWNALERVVEQSYGQFMRRVGAELERAAAAEPDWEGLEAAVERLSAVWENRLRTIARTLVHAAATRLRLAQA